MEKWPELFYKKAKASYDTLHLWTQIIGKIKLEALPWMNHSWHVTLKTTPTGLTTGNLPYENVHFQIDLNLIDHKLIITTSRGENEDFDLPGLAVADFCKKLFERLRKLAIEVKIFSKPVELVDPIRFEQDMVHKTYSEEHILALHKVLLATENVLTSFRCNFKGKSSSVHFFWGSFDQAVSLFSGRRAPKHPGGMPNLADWVVEEAYSHEVMSFGFWPGSEAFPEAAYYSYLYPEPTGYSKASIEPPGAFYHPDLREFILPYKLVQQNEFPDRILRKFLDSTYEAGTALANWDTKELEN